MEDVDRVAAGHRDDINVLQVLDGFHVHLPGDHGVETIRGTEVEFGVGYGRPPRGT